MSDQVIRQVIEDASERKRMGAGIAMLAEREREFPDRMTMELAGLAMIPDARDMLTTALTAEWDENARKWQRRPIEFALTESRELVIGAGFHAAVYAANRRRAGFPKPVVIDRAPAAQIGGAFAWSSRPVFYLNSENRPGSLPGLPARGEALNVLPGAMLQPSYLTSAEFPTNADMAWLIRLTLAQYAEVYPGVTVTGAAPGGNGDAVPVTFEDGKAATFGRVIDARGLGDPRGASSANGKTVLTFPQFMARMGEPFPLRDVRKVAVIGGGDSGKCAVEALVGIGPRTGLSLPGLDFVNAVDWYAEGLPRDRESWRRTERGRYARLASYLPTTINRAAYHDVTVLPGLPSVQPGAGYAQVGPYAYDLAILATGFDRVTFPSATTELYPDSLSPLARAGGEYYLVGPAADLPFGNQEIDSGVADIAANAVSMFRLAPRTATLAAMLPAV